MAPSPIPPHLLNKKTTQGTKPSLSVEYFKEISWKYYGDVAAVICSVIILGFVWPITTDIFSPFVSLQNNVTFPATNDESYTYVFGASDSFLVFFIAITWIVIHDLGKDLFWDRLAKRAQLAKDDARERNSPRKEFLLNGTYLFATFAFVVLGYYSLKNEGILSKYTSAWANYPFTAVTTSTKLFYLISLGYWLHLLVILPLLEVRSEAAQVRLFRGVYHSGILTVAVLSGFAPLGVLLYTLYNVVVLLDVSASLARTVSAQQQQSKRNNDSAPSFATRLSALAELSSKIGAVLIITIATHVLVLALNAAPEADFAAGNFNHIVFRLALLAAIVGVVGLTVRV